MISYRLEIVIDCSLEKTIQLFDSIENMKKWQPELISFNHIDGVVGEVGARSKLLYKIGNRHIEMIETILVKDLPKSFVGKYEAKGVLNEVENIFISLPNNKTLWIVRNKFTFSGFMKFVVIFLKRSYPKQTSLFMTRFKNFVEKSN